MLPIHGMVWYKHSNNSIHYFFIRTFVISTCVTKMIIQVFLIKNKPHDSKYTKQMLIMTLTKIHAKIQDNRANFSKPKPNLNFRETEVNS